MKVLVTSASRYGSTHEIAESIASVLGEAGHEVTCLPCAEVDGLVGYDGVVVGSAVYLGHWLEDAKDFVTSHAAALRERSAWLFSSGPVGDPPEPNDDPADAPALLATSGAREHIVFAGRLERSRLRFTDKAVTVALRVADGDFRDWDGIRTWAQGIASQFDRG